MQRFVFVVVAFLACGQAWAHGGSIPDGGIEHKRGMVQARAWVVGTHVSEPGEARDAFVRRLAGIMQTWTNEHGAEVCGYLATDGERWGVKLTTQRSQVMCILDPAIVPDGFRADRRSDTIHTHPTASNGGWLEVSADTERAAAAVGERGLEKKAPWATKVRVTTDGFSRDDYASGAGYLVANGMLYYQRGRGTQTTIGPIND